MMIVIAFQSLQCLYMCWTVFVNSTLKREVQLVTNFERILSRHLLAVLIPVQVIGYSLLRLSKSTRGFVQFVIALLTAMVGGSLVMFVVAFLFSAPMDLNTCYWSILASCVIVVQSGYSIDYKFIDLLKRVSIHSGSVLLSDPQMNCTWLQLLTSSFFTWISAAVIPLDWERPWQDWPICCTYGVIIGSVASNLVALITILRSSPVVKHKSH